MFASMRKSARAADSSKSSDSSRKKPQRTRSNAPSTPSSPKSRKHIQNQSAKILPESSTDITLRQSKSSHSRRGSAGSSGSSIVSGVSTSAYSRGVGSTAASAPAWPAPRLSSLRSSGGSVELKKKIKRPQARPSAAPPTKEIWRDKKAEEAFLNPTFGPDSFCTTEDESTTVPNSITFEDSPTEHEVSSSYDADLVHHREQVEQAEQVLRGMDAACESLQTQEHDLSKGITTHRVRAQGRYDSGNLVGAALSLRKLERSQAELTRVVLAMDELENQRDELAFLLTEFRAMRSLHHVASNELPAARPELNMTAYQTFDKEMEQALQASEAEEAALAKVTDQELLDKFLRNRKQ